MAETKGPKKAKAEKAKKPKKPRAEPEHVPAKPGESVPRSMTVDLFVPDDPEFARTRQVVASIRQYRHCLRKCFGMVAAAQVAGAGYDAETGRVIPDNDKAKAILREAFGKDGKAFAYELRDWFRTDFWPTSYSFVWDSLRADLETAWRARDAEFSQASRGWLIMQGGRDFNQFNRRGIGFPAATARPRLAGRTLTLTWDHDLGPVTFALPRIDGKRYEVWRCLRDGEPGWKLGTLFLSETDGRLRAVVTHERPVAVAEVDPARVLTLTVNRQAGGGDDVLFTLSGPGGQVEFDQIGSAGAVAFVRQQLVRRRALEARKAAYGSPRRPWGHRKGHLAAQDVLSRQTAQRERVVTDHNHSWTRRIVDRAVGWGCGVIEIDAWPGATLAGLPWNWSQFRQHLLYKAGETGIQVRTPAATPAGADQ